ncbi:hypothetical protein CWI37_0591p0030 [Hamiltosporidium tvaerminnensis]|uniref:Uncharacterized protein n=1 Tax=Hamiltosporidium tvaerminnensis TaxID=1176355 RepID=A0A4Q9L544_9MICR|nr:hypothetical protein CWI37_0591p0030 [Hamiltosporidium tvaerminnensis]
MANSANSNSFFKTKEFQIAAIVIFALIILSFIVIGIGITKATRIIKNFEKDFRLISETEEFKESVIKLKRSKFAAFSISGNSLVFSILEFNNSDMKVEEFFKVLERDEKNEVVSAFRSLILLKSFRTDNSLFLEVTDNCGFFAKIGFWFSRNHHTVYEINKISKFIYKEQKKAPKTQNMTTIFLNILNDNKLEVLENKMNFFPEKLENFSMYFVFEPLKIRHDLFNLFDLIIFISQKVRKTNN